MTLKKMRGAGGLEVYLDGGTHTLGLGDMQTISYDDLDGLYKEIGRAIAANIGGMSGEEARFLRKRLDMTQSELGMLGGKTDQVAAKWEKGSLPVPTAEASLLKLLWLAKFAPAHLHFSVDVGRLISNKVHPGCYVFRFDGLRWKRRPDTRAEQIQDSAAEGARFIVGSARAGACAYTNSSRAYT